MGRPERRRRAGGRKVAATLAVLLVLGACAGPRALRDAEREIQLGNWDAAIAHYRRVLERDPTNLEARIGLEHTRTRASQAHQKAGQELFEAGSLERAFLEYELAIRLDPGNQTAIAEFRRVEEALAERRRAERGQPSPTEEAIERAAQAPSPLPQLEPQVTGPISVDFRDTPVQEIYRSIGRIGGINVMFDPDLRDDTTSFQVDDVDLRQVIDILTASQGHFIKVLSPRAMMVINDDVTKRRQYEDQILRTFYLSNADAATVATLLRAIVGTTRVQENADLNTITIRETPERMAIAERIIRSQDKAGGEVLLDIEVFEVNRSALQEYGLSLPPYGGFASIAQDDAGISLEGLGDLDNTDIFLTIPSLRYQLLKQSNDFKLIAQPQLRVTEGQNTDLLIGQQVPVITTTFNPQTTSGGDVIPISSTDFRDVGIVISAQPRVHHNREVTLELVVEVSAVVGTSAIQNQPIFSSRRLAAAIRLRDGETNLLAGLLRDDERIVREGIPGIMDVPVLGALFSNTRKEVTQTDVVLSITPHILRAAEIDEEDLQAMYVGTETNVGGGVSGLARGPGQPGAGAGAPGGPGGGAGAEEQPPAIVALLPAEHVVRPGEEFAVDVVVEGAVELFSVGLRLNFNPDVIEYVDAFEGALMSQGGADTSFQASPTSRGELTIGYARIGDVGGVRGGGSLTTLVFRGVRPGSTPIALSAATIRNPEGRPQPAQLQPAQAEVVEGR